MDGVNKSLDRVTPARAYVVLLLTALIVVHGFFPKSFAVDGMTLALLGVLVVVILAPLLKSANLPGGTGLNFREQLDSLREESNRAVEDQSERRPVTDSPKTGEGDTPTTATAREPSPDHTETIPREVETSTEQVIEEILREAARSPRAALMFLSAELERAVRTLLYGSGWNTPQSLRSLRSGVRRLVELGVLTESAASALSLFSEIRNEIVHGVRRASDDEVLRAIDAGIELLRAVTAIPRERHLVQHTNVPVYVDSNASDELPGVTGLILDSTSPSGLTSVRRIFPTRRTDYQVGKEVAWEWGPLQWGEAWYRNPETQEIEQAWLGSMEFVGRHLDEI